MILITNIHFIFLMNHKLNLLSDNFALWKSALLDLVIAEVSIVIQLVFLFEQHVHSLQHAHQLEYQDELSKI